jgi:protoheme IX farnesyltransferase
MLGWVAATGTFGLEPGVLFAYQFVWQFPHFWAIAWLAYDDYAKAGYYLLPNRAKDALATRMTLFYTFWMILISLMPAWGLAGTFTLDVWAAVATGLLGIDVLYHAVRHWRAQEDASARALMFSTIRYLPLVQTIWVLDRFI